MTELQVSFHLQPHLSAKPPADRNIEGWSLSRGLMLSHLPWKAGAFICWMLPSS